MRFLLFTLYAPMGSFGEIAVGERRMSWVRPGRSAILGMVAAAKGIERTDEDAHRQLETGLYYAVRMDAPGRPFIDYHTTQTPKARGFATRRKELELRSVNTVLSSREWRVDAYFTVALWPRPDSTVELDGIANALKHPCFTLYVGRKSAPLGLPLNPEIVEAKTFVAAFAERRLAQEEGDILQHIRIDGTPHSGFACDDDAPGAPEHSRIEHRRDAIASRVRWQFADRLERVWEGDKA